MSFSFWIPLNLSRVLKDGLCRSCWLASAWQPQRNNSNRTAICRLNRRNFPRQYPTPVVLPDGSTITVRYAEPRKIIKVWFLLIKNNLHQMAWLYRGVQKVTRPCKLNWQDSWSLLFFPVFAIFCKPNPHECKNVCLFVISLFSCRNMGRNLVGQSNSKHDSTWW